MTAKARLLIADDHFIAREGLAALINDQPDLEVVATVKDGVEAVARFQELHPDLVLLDLRMPRFDGIQATAAIVRADARARVLIVSSYDTEEDIDRVRQAGALGYILKEAEGKELLRAIRTVLKGERYLPDAISAKLQSRPDGGHLTAREVQLLELLSAGLNNPEIAEHLSLSPNTVRVYLTDVFSKIGARNRTEAVAIALERGIVRKK